MNIMMLVSVQHLHAQQVRRHLMSIMYEPRRAQQFHHQLLFNNARTPACPTGPTPTADAFINTWADVGKLLQPNKMVMNNIPAPMEDEGQFWEQDLMQTQSLNIDCLSPEVIILRGIPTRMLQDWRPRTVWPSFH